MAGRRKTAGLFMGAIALGIIVSCILPMGFLAVLEGLLLIGIGWLLLRKG